MLSCLLPSLRELFTVPCPKMNRHCYLGQAADWFRTASEAVRTQMQHKSREMVFPALETVFWLFLSFFLPALVREVKLWLPPPIKPSYGVDGKIPRDINCHLKSLQRTFFPSCINSRNEEIGLDFILASAPQIFAHLKIPILNQACFY